MKKKLELLFIKVCRKNNLKVLTNDFNSGYSFLNFNDTF